MLLKDWNHAVQRTTPPAGWEPLKQFIRYEYAAAAERPSIPQQPESIDKVSSTKSADAIKSLAKVV
jgi:hypothetical protein